MEALNTLKNICKCGVFVSINEHRDYYESAETYILPQAEITKRTDKAVIDEMIKQNVIVQVQAFPDTPVGSFIAYHYNLEEALKEVLDAVQHERQQRLHQHIKNS